MQLGMIGLGRMGANMVRRLIKGGHECVVFDMSPQAVEELAKEKAIGAASLADLVQKLDEAARVWLMVPGRGRRQDDRRPAAAARSGRHPDRRRQLLLRRRHPPREGARAEGHPLRRRRHQRRRVGPGARLLHDDRRRDAGREASRSDLRDARARASATSPRTPGREKLGGTAEQGYLHCGPNGAGHFVKMVHNGIEYGIMAAYAEGLGILRAANVGKQTHDDRRRDDAAARSRALSVRSQPARHRRSLAARQRDRVVAARPDRGRADRGSRRSRSSPAASPIRAKAAGRSRRRSTKAVPAPVLTTALYERFSSRGEADFQDKLLSAMRFEFGGHLEKPADK